MKKPKFNIYDAQYICDTYNVPCKLHAPVEYKGQRGQVVGTRNSYIYIQLDGHDKPTGPLHPTWEINWLTTTPEDVK